MPELTVPELVRKIEERAQGKERIIVALAGPPASGKSTLAEELARGLVPAAAVLPMDGFHLDNETLQKMGLFHRKGAPQTFDAAGFVALLRKVRTEKQVGFPTFDREADSTVPDGGRIDDETRIVLVEGNYLLLNVAPWSGLQDLFDLTVALDVEHDELEKRLVQRWLDHGLSPSVARARALENDMKNAEYVQAHSFAADVTLRHSIL